MNSLRSDSMRVRRRRVGILAGVFLLAVLFFFDPETSSFYPPCLFRTFLGTQCPGCGSLRAAHQLLHGNFAEAWALNKPLLIALPLAAVVTLFTFLRRSSSSPPT
jgi:hypothetical protein